MRKLGNVLISVMADLSRMETNGYAKVRVNENICEPERFQRLLTYFTRGTILETVELDMDGMKPEAECVCGFRREIEDSHPGYVKCPNCGKFAEVQDNAYEIARPDPQEARRRESIRF
jgi:Zn finger protein HypA/HybF involved in hydrogenase expression